MGQAERDVSTEYLHTLTADQRRFRINSGVAWTGTVIHRPDGSLLIRNPRPFHGAPKGSPDFWGWDAVKITPEMVGQTVAIFCGEEVKSGRLQLSKFQRMFRDCLTKMGGRFRVVR